MEEINKSIEYYLNILDISCRFIYLKLFEGNNKVLNYDYKICNNVEKKDFIFSFRNKSNLLTSATILGSITKEINFDIFLVFSPKVTEIYDMLITYEYPKIKYFDILLSGFLPTDIEYNLDNLNVFSQSSQYNANSNTSPVIRQTAISSNFKSLKNMQNPLTWGQKAVGSSVVKKSINLLNEVYFVKIILKEGNENLTLFNVQNILYIFCNINFFEEFKDIVSGNENLFVVKNKQNLFIDNIYNIQEKNLDKKSAYNINDIRFILNNVKRFDIENSKFIIVYLDSQNVLKIKHIYL